MKLSEAILEGAKIRQQTFGSFFDLGGSCALGAAYEAAEGVHYLGISYEEIAEVFPELYQLQYVNNDGVVVDLGDLIIDMNDKNHMSREQIAAWLAEQGY